jgi:hypothetical protein
MATPPDELQVKRRVRPRNRADFVEHFRGQHWVVDGA